MSGLMPSSALAPMKFCLDLISAAVPLPPAYGDLFIKAGGKGTAAGARGRGQGEGPGRGAGARGRGSTPAVLRCC